jgi:hypothetical protein
MGEGKHKAPTIGRLFDLYIGGAPFQIERARWR